MENPRKRYVQQFKKYPDVVSVLTFREMLGGIGDSFARKLIRDGLVKAIFIKPHYGMIRLVKRRCPRRTGASPLPFGC